MHLFFKKFFAFLTALSLIPFLSVAGICEPNIPSKTSENPLVPIQIKGDAVEYFQTERKAVGTGHVTIDYEGARLSADKITVYMDTKIAVAEGHVKLEQEGTIFTGERAEFDFGKKIGHVSKMTAEIDKSLYGKAQRVEKVSENHYRMVDGYVSTCCGDNPFYKVVAHEVDFYPNDKVVARNALLYVKNVPIIFIPYFVVYFLDFDRFPVQLIPGKNSEWGAFLLSKWRYHLVERPDLQSKGNVLLDYRQKRGFAGGVENFYRGDKIGHGTAKIYYANDNNPPADADSDRYRAQWRHQSKIGKSTTFTAEINKLSDKDFIKDFFFREEYERDVFPDNYVSIVTSKPEYSLSILDRERLDDFFTVVERSPEVRFDTHTQRFADTPFYLRQEVQFSNLNKEFVSRDSTLNAVRLDTNHTVSYAGHVGHFSVVPRIGTRQTYYSKNLEKERDVVRSVFDPGLDVSTHFYKTYDVYLHSYGFDYNQIRHIFAPTASYNYRHNPTVSRTTLPQFDSIDAIDKQNFIRFSFENRFQTKEHRGSDNLAAREIARIIPFFDMDLHTGRLDNVGVEAELRPYSWLGIESDASFNTKTGHFETANFDVYLKKDNYKLAVGQRYIQDDSTQLTAQLEWQINKEWGIKLYERFEFETNESEEFEVTVSKLIEDCVIADFTYNNRDGSGHSFFVMFRLKNFPENSFNLKQKYIHPKESLVPPTEAVPGESLKP